MKIAITGCNRGLGLSIATFLLALDYEVIGLNRTQADISHPKFTQYNYNTNFNSKELEELSTQLGEIDILILNAGVKCTGEIDLWKNSEILEAINTNALAPFSLIRELAPSIRKRIISFGSDYDEWVNPSTPVYSMSKRLMNDLMKSSSPIVKDFGVSLVHLTLPGVSDTMEMNTKKLNELILELIESNLNVCLNVEFM